LVDKELLRREEKGDLPGWLAGFAYPTVLLIGLGHYGSMGWGLRRLQCALAASPVRQRIGS
jgi:hypothetical protein